MVTLTILGIWAEMEEIPNELLKAHRLQRIRTCFSRSCEDFRILVLEFEENLRNSSWKRNTFAKLSEYDSQKKGGVGKSTRVSVQGHCHCQGHSRPPRRLSIVHFCAIVPSEELTNLLGHHSHFYPLLHETVVHKAIQIGSKCLIPQALTEGAQLGLPKSSICILLPWELSPKPGRSFCQSQASWNECWGMNTQYPTQPYVFKEGDNGL